MWSVQSIGLGVAVRALGVGVVFVMLAGSLYAQTAFNSDSTGANGPFPPRVPPEGTNAITLNLNDGVVTFLPPNILVPPSPLPNVPASGFADGILHFTTFDLAADIILTFVPNANNTPVVMLATGDITIAGVIDLNGAAASNNVSPGNEAPGGPGGFRGGLGVEVPQTGNDLVAATAGEGPGGGAPGTASDICGNGGGHGTPGGGPFGGQNYGDSLLRLLIGGSGGGGGFLDFSNGGGGGGAILLAASGTIQLNGGSILANGGASGRIFNTGGGGGAGGGIRLVANRIEGVGTGSALQASGGPGPCSGSSNRAGGLGRIRLEAFFVAGIMSTPGFVLGPPLTVGLPSPALGTIDIIDVAGEVVQQPPTGNTSMPDVRFSDAGEITVNLATSGVPVGTTLVVRVSTGEQIIEAPSTPTDAAGNAMARLTVPAGIGTIQAFATLDTFP